MRVVYTETASRQMWIPRTKYVLLYRIEPGDVFRILALYHTSQDRNRFNPAATD